MVFTKKTLPAENSWDRQKLLFIADFDATIFIPYTLLINIAIMLCALIMFLCNVHYQSLCTFRKSLKFASKRRPNHKNPIQHKNVGNLITMQIK